MHSILRLLALLALVTLHSARAEEQRMFVVETWFIVVPETKALAWQEKLLDIGAEEKVCDELLAAAHKGEVKLASHLRTKAAERAASVAEQVTEKRYPIEFEQPMFPTTKEEAAVFKDEWLVITPTTFETRNVGATNQMTVTGARDGQLRVEGDTRHVRFLSMEKFECFKLKSGFVGGVEQPKFHTIRNTVNVFVRSGERTLIGTNRAPEPEGHWEFAILRVSEVPKKEEKK